jgi:peptidoglycan/xylan/chitin deacetylase (PgdA/CDA1 family)
MRFRRPALAAIASLALASCRRDPIPETNAAALGLAPSLAPARARPPARVKVEGYRASLQEFTGADGERGIVLRTLDRGGVPHALVVSPQDLKTRIEPSERLKMQPATWASLARSFEGSAYFRALRDAAQRASALQDAGITHVLPEEHGVVLTVDLCPSHRRLDAVLFERIVSIFSPEEHPVPVAIAITGLWMEDHRPELARLLELVGAGKLEITWINHSYHHRYDPKLPLTENFLLEKGTRIDDEILMNEAAMIEAGITPSVLFRFPGLISNDEIVERVIDFGLIPIGSDAWLAKKERAHSGDIVLVHGNGNEPKGISAFFAMLASEKKSIKRHQFLLLDIREGIQEEEEK